MGGERARPACGFGRRARIIVGQISLLTGFRRDAENGNRDGRAPHSKIVAADVSPLIIPTGGGKFEPTHVGCYGILNAAVATGRVARPVKYGGDYGKPWRGALFHRARRTMLGDDGNQIMAHSAVVHKAEARTIC